eukprot:5024830-Amphidinium_carterae.1
MLDGRCQDRPPREPGQAASRPRRQVAHSKFGPGHDIRHYTVRPSLRDLYWCATCGAYASRAIASLRGCCPGERKPGSAAACSRINRGVHPQHAQAIRGSYLEPFEPEVHADPKWQDPSIGAINRLRPAWLM